MTAEDVTLLVHKLAALVAGARRLLADNKRVDLSALAGKVEEIGVALDRAPPADPTGLKGQLAEIVANLDHLSAALTEQHRALAAETGAARLRASQVYGAPTPKPTE